MSLTARTCFGVTEPDAGLDTSRIKTRAVRKGDHYVVHGQKIWTSTAQQADKIVLLARTTPIEECAKPTDGLTLFLADKDPRAVTVTEIPKMGRHAVDSNQTFIDGLEVPVEHRIGEEGQGFRYILDSLNPERILNAAEVLGIGRRALEEAPLGPYVIPRRTNVIVSPYIIHRDPRFWSDPEKFDPDRFNTDEEVEYVGQRTIEVVKRLRDMSPLYELAKEGVDLKSIKWKAE